MAKALFFGGEVHSRRCRNPGCFRFIERQLLNAKPDTQYCANCGSSATVLTSGPGHMKFDTSSNRPDPFRFVRDNAQNEVALKTFKGKKGKLKLKNPKIPPVIHGHKKATVRDISATLVCVTEIDDDETGNYSPRSFHTEPR